MNEINEVREAADEARKLVKMFRSVQVVAEAFDKIADIDRLTAEVNNRLAIAKELENEEIKKRDTISSEATAIKAAAIAAADKIKADAKVVIDEAKSKERAIHAKMAAMTEDMHHIEGQLEKKRLDKLEELAAIEVDIAARTKSLADLNTNIAEARDAVKKLLGG